MGGRYLLATAIKNAMMANRTAVVLIHTIITAVFVPCVAIVNNRDNAESTNQNYVRADENGCQGAFLVDRYGRC